VDGIDRVAGWWDDRMNRVHGLFCIWVELGYGHELFYARGKIAPSTSQVLGVGQDGARSCVVGHDGEEFLFINLSVLIKVKFFDHGLTGVRGDSDRQD